MDILSLGFVAISVIAYLIWSIVQEMKENERKDNDE